MALLQTYGVVQFLGYIIMVKAQGLSLHELFPQPGKAKSQPKGNSQAEALKVKYRNPDNASQTWAGTGRKPAWIVEALSSGKTLEELTVGGLTGFIRHDLPCVLTSPT